MALATGVLTVLHGFGSAILAGTSESIPGTLIWVLDLALRGLTLNRTIHPYVSKFTASSMFLDLIVVSA